MKTVIVTGSGGLIGAQCVRHFAGRREVGVDNDMRAYFFGDDGLDRVAPFSELQDLSADNFLHEGDSTFRDSSSRSWRLTRRVRGPTST